MKDIKTTFTNPLEIKLNSPTCTPFSLLSQLTWQGRGLGELQGHGVDVDEADGVVDLGAAEPVGETELHSSRCFQQLLKGQIT